MDKERYICRDNVFVKVAYKKYHRLKKKLRTTTLCNNALKNTNKELVTKVQELKEVLSKAEQKLNEMNAERVQAISSSTFSQGMFNQLVSKIYEAVALTAFKDGMPIFPNMTNVLNIPVQFSNRDSYNNFIGSIGDKINSVNGIGCSQEPSSSGLSSRGMNSCLRNRSLVLSPVPEQSTLQNDAAVLSDQREELHVNNTSNVTSTSDVAETQFEEVQEEHTHPNEDNDDSGNNTVPQDLPRELHVSFALIPKKELFDDSTEEYIQPIDGNDFTHHHEQKVTVQRFNKLEDSALRAEALDSFSIFCNEPSNALVAHSELPSLPCNDEAVLQNCEDSLKPIEEKSNSIVSFFHVAPRRRRALSPTSDCLLLNTKPSTNQRCPVIEETQQAESEDVVCDSQSAEKNYKDSTELFNSGNKEFNPCLHSESTLNFSGNIKMASTPSSVQRGRPAGRGASRGSCTFSGTPSSGKKWQRKNLRKSRRSEDSIPETRLAKVLRLTPRTSPRLHKSPTSSNKSIPKRRKKRSPALQSSQNSSPCSSSSLMPRRVKAIVSYKEPSCTSSLKNVAPVNVSPQNTLLKSKTIFSNDNAHDNKAWFCSICNQNKQIAMIECLKCKLWFHVSCAKISYTQLIFFCKVCKEN